MVVESLTSSTEMERMISEGSSEVSKGMIVNWEEKASPIRDSAAASIDR